METHIHKHEFQSINKGGGTRIIIPKQPGYKFNPSDELLIGYYLRRKLANLRLPRNRIFEVNLYEFNPKKLSADYKKRGEKECYFFTPRERKYKNGNRPNRACKDGGYWKASGADKPVVDINNNNSLIGYKKALVFYEGKPPNGKKTNWIMHEFRINEPPPCTRMGPNDMRLDDWVLCKLYENKDDEEESESNEDEDHDQELPSLLDVGNNEEEYPEYEEIVAPPIYNYSNNFVQSDYCTNINETYWNNLFHVENDQLPVLDNQLTMDHNLQPQMVDYGSQQILQQPPNMMNSNNDVEMGDPFAADVVAQPIFNEVHPNNIFKSKHLSDQSMSLPEDYYQNAFLKDPS